MLTRLFQFCAKPRVVAALVWAALPISAVAPDDLPQGTAAVSSEVDLPQGTAAVSSEVDLPQGTAAVSREVDLPQGTAAVSSEDDLPQGAAAVSSKVNEVFAGFVGSFSQSVPIAVPAYHGIEPRVGLGYSSAGGNGLAGAGWSLGGFSVVQRAGAGRGTPRWDSTDIFLLNGAELVQCGSSGASCLAGGAYSAANQTYTTKDESYLKIKFDSATSSWSVWGRDGTKTVFTSVYTITGTGYGTYRWGQTSVTDTNGNAATYAWTCVGSGTYLTGDCYPDQVNYGPYSLKLYWETRDDRQHFATGVATSMGITTQRLRSILVSRGTPIRASRLAYSVSAVTSRSRLNSIQEYGRDVLIDATGVITLDSGSFLPARTFTYESDTVGQSFQPWGN